VVAVAGALHAAATVLVPEAVVADGWADVVASADPEAAGAVDAAAAVGEAMVVTAGDDAKEAAVDGLGAPVVEAVPDPPHAATKTARPNADMKAARRVGFIRAISHCWDWRSRARPLP
jgi:hypothetical protein